MAERRSFRLHFVNIVLVVLFTGFGFVRPFIWGVDGAEATAYELGRSFGFGFGLVLVAGIGSMIVWFISRRNVFVANVIFGFLMCFGALGQLQQSIQTVSQNQDFADLQVSLREEASEDIGRARELSDSYFEDLIENSSGDERKSFQATKVYMGKLMDVRERWDAAQLAFADDRIFDVTLLVSAEEYEFQKTVLKEYSESSSEMAITYRNSSDLMRTALVETDMGKEYLEEFMTGFRKSAEKGGDTAAKLFSAHKSHADAYTEMLDILETNEWSLDDGSGLIVFASDEADEIYAIAIDAAIEFETKINQLAEEIDRIEQAKHTAS